MTLEHAQSSVVAPIQYHDNSISAMVTIPYQGNTHMYTEPRLHMYSIMAALIRFPLRVYTVPRQQVNATMATRISYHGNAFTVPHAYIIMTTPAFIQYHGNTYTLHARISKAWLVMPIIKCFMKPHKGLKNRFW